jgi:pSer/pThr/pTyr-binding forkhead associated (FHA) protein
MPCWIIGSGSECDVVVDQPTVSDRHCRLTRTVEGEFLEDLGSSNGTFINGVRVQGRARVHRSDRITLGKRVPMPWPLDSRSQAAPVPPRVITIGRAVDNDVVIDDSVVSGRHARIVVEGGRARIEDLGSSNGTALNSRERRIESAPLDEADVVFLGSYRIPAARLLHAGDEPAAEVTSRIVVRGPAMLFGRDRACDQVLRPGEGEETAAKRLLERVFTHYPRFFDGVVGDALYFDAPFINFCLDHHKQILVTAKGENRLLLQDAAGLFAQQGPGCWVAEQGRRTEQFWDEEDFTSCEGVKQPLRVLRTEETVRRRERITGEWQEKEETTTWSWTTALRKAQLSTHGLWRCGHGR